MVPPVATPDAAFFHDVDAIQDGIRSTSPAPAVADSPGASEIVWTLAELVGESVPEGEFLLHVDAADAPDRRSARYRCVPLTESVSELREGSLVLVSHAKLSRGGQAVGAGLGKWMVRPMLDAASGARRMSVFLRGPVPPLQLELSLDEWSSFRPLGRLTRDGD